MFIDLVVRHGENGKVVVLYAKFKKMELLNKDIDRNDLYQINSYSGYYRNQIMASGLTATVRQICMLHGLAATARLWRVVIKEGVL